MKQNADTHTHAHTHTHSRTRTQTHTHAHTHIHTHTHTHTHSRTHIHAHTLTHTSIHPAFFPLLPSPGLSSPSLFSQSLSLTPTPSFTVHSPVRTKVSLCGFACVLCGDVGFRLDNALELLLGHLTDLSTTVAQPRAYGLLG